METKNSIAEIITLVIFGIILISYIIWQHQYEIKSRVVVYDCSIAEISPDFPVSVKEECRKAKNDRRTNQTSK
jgi:hypothetical protein